MPIREETGAASEWRRLFKAFFLASRAKAAGKPYAEPEAHSFVRLEEYASSLFAVLKAEGEGGIKDSDGNPVTVRSLTGAFNALWALEVQFINCFSMNRDGTRTDEYWELLTDAVDALVRRHPIPFVVHVTVAFLDEVERRDKTERAAAAANAGGAA